MKTKKHRIRELYLIELTGDDFVLGLHYTKDQFKKSQLNYLCKRGKWLISLENKLAPAAFKNAKHFVEVFAGRAEPVRGRELLWKKYKAALLEEKEHKKKRMEEAKNSEQYKIHASRISAP